MQIELYVVHEALQHEAQQKGVQGAEQDLQKRLPGIAIQAAE
jgi:hypothetical protein